MKILILGAGGTGGYFGGRLAQGGADVTFLVRERRAQQLADHGLRIESPSDKITLPVQTVLAADVKPIFDVIILACKAYDLASSIEAITPAMGENTFVVPLLNGIAHLDQLDTAFGALRVLGGSCQIAATLTPDGIVKSMADTHLILWGAREKLREGEHRAQQQAQQQAQHQTQQQTIAAALGDAFAKTIVTWKVSDNIMLDMWEKVAFLSTLAGMTCLMRANVGEILATPDGRAIMTEYVRTSMAIATAEGYPPRANMVERFEKILDSTGSTLTASMLRDLESSNPVEADHIVGFMLGKARQHGIDDSLIRVAYTHLKAYEIRRWKNKG